jgi:hypothetical protein
MGYLQSIAEFLSLRRLAKVLVPGTESTQKERLIMNRMPGRSFLLLFIAALGLVSPTPVQAWGLADRTLQRVLVPSTLNFAAAETSADFDRDGIPEELVFAGDRATIRTGNQIRWQSPELWRVAQAQIADLNHDDLPEVVLLVWRPFKPWPVDAWLPNGGRIKSFHDSNGFSCHIILIGWKQAAFRELWAGSAMADPVKSFAATDLAGKAQQYLVTLEGAYDDPPAAPSRRVKVWEWNGFGFSIVNELQDAFSFMSIAQIDDRQVLILTR